MLDDAGARLLATAAARMALSARGYDRVRKVARTIADLAGADVIDAEHVAEALQFRMRPEVAVPREGGTFDRSSR